MPQQDRARDQDLDRGRPRDRPCMLRQGHHLQMVDKRRVERPHRLFNKRMQRLRHDSQLQAEAASGAGGRRA